MGRFGLTVTNQEILNLQTDDEWTIGDYLKNLLKEVFIQGEGFSGKRPFGDSGWEYDVYIPLVKAGIIDGSIDEDGYVDEIDSASAEQLIIELIEKVFDEYKLHD